MIIISLDEYGDFEKKNNKPVFIAGLIYDDCGNEKDIEYEKERIRDYYRRVISSAKNTYINSEGDKASDDIKKMFTYPQALHCNNAKDQNTVVKYVKEAVNSTLGEFISSCSYKGKKIIFKPKDNSGERERKGRYHFFSMLKGMNGMPTVWGHANKMVDDDCASNLYFHMAGRTVSRLVFHNPLYPESMPEVKLNIATRSSADFEQLDEAKKKEYKDLSYEKKEKVSKDGKKVSRFYSLMNADTYRALIADEMLRCRDREVKVSEFYVYPIKYDLNFENGFAYLSDSICSYLGFNLKSSHNPYINEINRMLNEVNPENVNLVFVYDPIDNYYSQAVEAFEKKDLYEALSLMYDAECMKGAYATFYNKRLFGMLRERILDTENMVAIGEAARKLSEFVYSNNLSQEKLKYISDSMKEIVENLREKGGSSEARDKAMFSIWEAGMSASSHTGDASGAIDCFNEASKYLRSAGIDAVINLNNKLVVALEDLFASELAEEQALKNIKFQSEAGTLLDSFLEDGRHASGTARGRALSQYARVLAERREPKAATYFREAMGCFGKMTSDYKMSQSFLLHFLADMAEHNADLDYLKQFEKEANDYFDGRTEYIDRLMFVNSLTSRKDDILSKNFAYYVLFRGMFLNHRMKKTRLDSVLWESVKTSGFSAENGKGVLTKGHPWEIIYKYLRMIAFIQGDDAYGQYCLEQQSVCLKDKGKTIEALMMYGEIQVMRQAGDTLAWDKTAKDLVSYIKSHFMGMKGRKFSKDREILYIELSEIFTFMFR